MLKNHLHQSHQAFQRKFCLLFFSFFTIWPFGFASGQSLSGNPIEIPNLVIQQLAKYQGQYLTAYYSHGRVSGLTLDYSKLNMNKAYVVLADLQITGDQLLLPQQQIFWTRIEKPNFLLLVVHPQARFFWSNSDSSSVTWPSGYTQQGSAEPTAITIFPLNLLSQFPGNAEQRTLNFGSNSNPPSPAGRQLSIPSFYEFTKPQ